SGEGWPDAATAAPLAAALDVPVLLVRRDYLPSQTASALAEWKTTSAIVVGGDSVVSSGVVAGLPMPIRLSGPTRYETAYQVARFGLDEALLPERLLLATGAKFPDAISGASLAARLRAHDLFVTVDEMPPPTRNYLIENRLELTRVIILGATGSVGSSMESRVSKVLDLWRDL
ncbi:MAG: cell wall-binding repeat-containing protein, partial [Coriobacteriia bacterium]|nr:cell wall-binding repeat-containing protein [Coriobacteriia bacterium]